MPDSAGALPSPSSVRAVFQSGQSRKNAGLAVRKLLLGDMEFLGHSLLREPASAAQFAQGQLGDQSRRTRLHSLAPLGTKLAELFIKAFAHYRSSIAPALHMVSRATSSGWTGSMPAWRVKSETLNVTMRCNTPGRRGGVKMTQPTVIFFGPDQSNGAFFSDA